MEKIKLLSNEIYSFTYPDIEDFLKLKNNILKESYQKNIKKDFSEKSIDINLHKREVYSKFFGWIYKCLDHVVEAEKYNCDSLKITQCWANKNSPGQISHSHYHCNSIISGIFYLTDGEPTSFAVDNIWYVGNPSPLCLHGEDFKYLSDNVKCKPCQLILFPSTIMHRVYKNKSLNDRYTISFNTWFNGKWGCDEFLTGVNTEVL